MHELREEISLEKGRRKFNENKHEEEEKDANK